MKIQDERYALSALGDKVALKDQDDNIVLVITDTDRDFEKKRARAIHILDCVRIARYARNVVNRRKEKHAAKEALTGHHRNTRCEHPIPTLSPGGKQYTMSCVDQRREAILKGVTDFTDPCVRCVITIRLNAAMRDTTTKYSDAIKRLEDICRSTSIIHTSKPNEEHIDNDTVHTDDQGTEG